MRGSWRLGSVAGTNIYVHWTMLLVVASLLAFRSGAESQSWEVAVSTLVLAAAAFGCILLHELAHMLAARHYGIVTHDVALIPIGSVARLERIPSEIERQIVIALAGPAANLLLTAVFALFVSHREEMMAGMFAASASLSAKLVWINAVVAGFNLLPASPFDGGRVLRAALTPKLGYLRATQLATGLGQGLAIAFALAGIWTWQPLLLFVSLFVYLGTQGEAGAFESQSVLQGVTVREAMTGPIRALRQTALLREAAEALTAGSQEHFPVVDDAGQVLGILRPQDVLRGLSDGNFALPVVNYSTTGCGVADAQEMLDRVVLRMQSTDCTAMPVVERGRLVGSLTLADVGHFVATRAAEAQRTPVRPSFRDDAWNRAPVARQTP